nr:cupin domain-containing protein [Acetobacter persici]
MYPIITFNQSEHRVEGFLPWVDAEHPSFSENNFFSGALYYVRNDDHDVYTGEARLKAFDATIECFPVDLLLIVTAGEIRLEDDGGPPARFQSGQAVVVPRSARVHWTQTEGTRVFFMHHRHDTPDDQTTPRSRIVPIDPAGALEPASPPPADLILGASLPAVGRRTLYTSTDGKFTVGLWGAEPYRRRLAAFGDYELMHFLEGQVTLTNAIGESQTYGPGETLIVNRAISNAWESNAYIKKIYCKISV